MILAPKTNCQEVIGRPLYWAKYLASGVFVISTAKTKEIFLLIADGKATFYLNKEKKSSSLRQKIKTIREIS